MKFGLVVHDPEVNSAISSSTATIKRLKIAFTKVEKNLQVPNIFMVMLLLSLLGYRNT